MFFGVAIDSKSVIHFFRPVLETPDNPEKINFSGLSKFSGVGVKNGLQHLFWQVKKPLY